jgi:hypothetical protein
MTKDSNPSDVMYNFLVGTFSEDEFLRSVSRAAIDDYDRRVSNLDNSGVSDLTRNYQSKSALIAQGVRLEAILLQCPHLLQQAKGLRKELRGEILGNALEKTLEYYTSQIDVLEEKAAKYLESVKPIRYRN